MNRFLRILRSRERTLGGILTVAAALAVALTLWSLEAIPGEPFSQHRTAAQVSIETPPPPQLPQAVLGNPTNLAASVGRLSGAVDLSWTPAANANIHLVYLIKADGTDGRYWSGTPEANGSAVIESLDVGVRYMFIVIAGQALQTPGTYRWSEWSNWARATPVDNSNLPSPPTQSRSVDPQEVVRYAEFEGRVVSIDHASRSFRLRVYEVEHLRGVSTPTTVTVERTSDRSLPSWLRVGRYVEAEGRYYSSTQTLVAWEIDAEDDDWDDDDWDDDDDDDDDD